MHAMDCSCVLYWDIFNSTIENQSGSAQRLKKKKTAVGSNNSKIGLSSGIAGSWCLSSNETVKMGTTSYRLKFYLPKERASFPMVSVEMLGVMFIGLIGVSYGRQYSACLSAFIHNHKSVWPQMNKLNGVQ